LITFSTFFDISFQENVKNAFLNFEEKKRKIRILEHCARRQYMLLVVIAVIIIIIIIISEFGEHDAACEC